MAFGKNKKNKLTVRDKGNESIAPRKTTDLWTDFDRLFDQFRTSFDDLLWNPTTAITSRTPLMDVEDHGDKYEMNIEMPGIPKEDINIEVTPNTIEISAEHEETDEGKGKNYLRRERSSTSFYRSLDLPEELKTDNVDAELEDGVLKISLPKLEPKPKKKSKKVEIK